MTENEIKELTNQFNFIKEYAAHKIKTGTFRFLVYLIAVFTFNHHITNFSFTTGVEITVLIFFVDTVVSAFSDYLFDRDFLNSFNKKNSQ